MTDAKMALLELVEQEADTDLVREMLTNAPLISETPGTLLYAKPTSV